MNDEAMGHYFKGTGARVVGHRGSPRHAHENTFESFDAAEAEGAEGWELDVRLTYDGEVVVFHDSEIVFQGRRMPIASLTMAELSEVRLGPSERPMAIPTLRDLFLRYGTGGRYLVEMKAGPTPRPGLLEHRVGELLARFRLLDKAMVLCFSADMLRRIKEQEPEVATCLNFDSTTYRPLGCLVPELPKGCDAIGPHVALATDALLAEAKTANLAVHVWTVNDPVFAAHLATQGVASIITDVPAEIGPAVRAVTGRPAPLEIA